MGLERLAAVLQHVHSNYEIDLFQDLIRAAVRETGAKDFLAPSLRVIADHIRACAFLIVDGVIPGSEGRGYVLRRIIRRAIRHGYQLGQKQPFFHRLVADLDRVMGDAYPELRRDADARRAGAAAGGGALRRDDRERHEDARAGARRRPQGARRRDGVHALRHVRLPVRPHRRRLPRARRHGRRGGLRRGDGGAARARARREPVQGGREARLLGPADARSAATTRCPPRAASPRSTRKARRCRRSTAGERGVVVLSETPFYAESGGQVGDRGELSKGGVCLTLFAVDDTQKIQPEVFGHFGVVVTGELKVGDTVAANVDHAARARTMRNHSATHLMHKALRDVLGAARPAEGLARRPGQDALRLRARRAADRRRDPPHRGDRQRRDPAERADARRA